MQKSDRLLFTAGALFIGGYFLLLTGHTVHGYFSPDDMMNLYKAWSLPLGLLIKGNLLFFLHSPYYRPLAEAWYRLVYYFAGFNPQPFKVINLLILLANIFLTYSVARPTPALFMTCSVTSSTSRRWPGSCESGIRADIRAGANWRAARCFTFAL